jgi:hypothetical protein
MGFKPKNGEDLMRIRIKYLDETLDRKQPIKNKKINIPFVKNFKGCYTDRNPGLRIL